MRLTKKFGSYQTEDGRGTIVPVLVRRKYTWIATLDGAFVASCSTLKQAREALALKFGALI